MRKILIPILFAFGICMVANAQYYGSRWTVGGGLGLQFGDYTLINIAPQIGYDLTNFMNLGVGVTYSHYKEKYENRQYRYSNNYLGVNAYARVYPLPFTVLMIQPEVNRMWQKVKYRGSREGSENDKVVPVCLIGAGLRFGAMTAMIQYDLAQNSHSPYGSKLFYSIGYIFNL